MTGIDRLRTLAGAWDEWGLGGALAEIADEIERERAEDCYRMGLDCGTVWRVVSDMERHCLGHEGMEDSPVARWARELREALGGAVTDEDREAAAWVREHGGLEKVKQDALCWNTAENIAQATLDWLARVCPVAGIEKCGYGVALEKLEDAINRRLMPESCEWPRYESGDLVMFGDCVENRNGTCTVNSVRFYSGGGVSVYGEDRGAQFVVVTEPVMRDPIRKANPKVLASDGEPLEVGQTVWDVDAEADTPLTVVEVSSDLVRCEYTWKDGKTYRPCYPPNQLTHEHPDSWQRIEEDVMVDAKDYCESRGISSEYTKHSGKAKCEDIVRRCKALAERGE